MPGYCGGGDMGTEWVQMPDTRCHNLLSLSLVPALVTAGDTCGLVASWPHGLAYPGLQLGLASIPASTR